MRNLLQIIILAIVVPIISSGCATYKAVQDSAKPQTFKQTIAYVDGQIAGLRDLTAFTLNAKNEDCKARPNTDLCAAAAKVDKATKDYIAQQDLILTAYGAADGVLNKCQIVYGGVTLPCESQEDAILAGLIQLKTLLPKGDKSP